MRRGASTVWWCIGYGLFVVYGSLVPLDFTPLPMDVALERFRHIPYLDLGVDSRADWIANGVLYAPLGFGSARWLLQLLRLKLPALVTAFGLCAALAVAVEFTQLFFPPRTVSQNDLIAECLGSALGALAAPLLARWVDRIGHAWPDGGTRFGARLLELYAFVYALLSFFPYDFVLSAAELRDKLHGDGWGWLLAPQQHGVFVIGLQLVLETALSMPLGVLLARRRHRWSGAAAAAVGLGVGVLIEGGQLLMESGVSQGASVLTRALGLVLGLRLAPHGRAIGLAGARAWLRRLWWPLALVYLVLLGVATGIFEHRWRHADEIATAWHELRLMPFYYHYFTTESAALFSLCRVALLYAPVAVLGWAAHWRRRTSVSAATGLALVVEAAKLAATGVHADPTNLLIAATSAATTAGLLTLGGRKPAAPHRTGSAAPPDSAAAAPTVPGAGTSPPAWWALGVLPLVTWWALCFPLWQAGVLMLLVSCAAAVWRWPVLALALVPAALPVFDLAPWSGRFFGDEFDALVVTVVAVAWARTSRVPPPRRWRAIDLAFLLLGLSLAASTLRGLWPPPWPDANAFSSYDSPYNAWRIAKGAGWAWCFVRLWQRLAPSGAARGRCFGAGMIAGLAATVLAVIWERQVFAGLWDFSTDFRVSGPISAMHKGGAYIECWLAVASAFAATAALRATQPLQRALAVVLLAGASYATLVTYSRNGYAAFVVALLAALLCAAPWRARSWRHAAWAALCLAAVVGVAVPVAGGSYARERLSQSRQDLAVRQAHWADGLDMRDDTALSALVGMGIGRFPATHFWRSREAQHAASYHVEHEGGQGFLRLGAGATLYIEQIVARPDSPRLRLSMDVRAPSGPVALAVSLCEKWGLSSRACVAATVAAPAPATAWQHVELPLDAAPLLAGGKPLLQAPLKFALATPARGTVDVARLRLETANGQPLLANGDFAQGMDRWFFATDVDPPWHLHSLPLAVLFDQGWFGVLAWAAVAALALAAGARLAWRGAAQVAAAPAAVLGFLVSGSLNTLIDAPRFLFLLLVLLWLSAAHDAPGDNGATQPARRPRRGAAATGPAAAA